MDRVINYPGPPPFDTDFLKPAQNAMTALGYLAQGVFGTSTAVWGLGISQTTVASMAVNIAPGAILYNTTLEGLGSFGSLPQDTSTPLVKIGINLAQTQLTLTAPGTVGYSQVYLIEAAFTEADTSPVVLPYYNAASPSTPYNGPGNAGTAQNTLRTQRVTLQLKAGTPATTGSQTVPAADSGYVALYAITVTNGQTTITTANLASGNPYGAAVVPGAPFINWALPNLTPGFSRMQVFSSSTTWTVPAGVTQASVQVWGAGGGSGGTWGAATASQGGGGGEYAEGVVTGLTPGTVITITIGAAGTAGASAATPTAGGTGGTSSFGASITALGGGGGLPSSSGGVGGAATGGSGGSGGSFRVPGNTSSGISAMGGGIMSTSQGGGAFGTTGGHFGFSATSAAGASGIFPGGGAGGSANQAAGAAGAGGCIIVRY